MSRPPRLAASYSTVSANDLLKNVVCDYQIESPLECVFWQRGSNDTYLVRCSDTRYSLRVYRCGAFPRESIEFEAEVLSYLHGKGGSVAYPIERKTGGYFTEIEAPEGSRFVLLTSYADGTTPDYSSMESCRLVGESVARVHQLSSGFETSRQRTRLDLQSLLEDSLVTIRSHWSHRPQVLSFVEQIANDARASVLAVVEESLDTGICHGDLHGSNLHLHEGKVTHFDFEECAFGYRVYDLATFKWGCCIGERRAKRWPAFVEGYEAIRPIGKVDSSLIDTFVIIRELSNIAYGLRNIADFGHEMISDSELDDLRQELEELVGKKG
jgi:Ser/Thr protein kinase RdoA (MazF antagonist)